MDDLEKNFYYCRMGNIMRKYCISEESSKRLLSNEDWEIEWCFTFHDFINLKSELKDINIRIIKYYKWEIPSFKIITVNEKDVIRICCETCKHDISSICLECDINDKSKGWEPK